MDAEKSEQHQIEAEYREDGKSGDGGGGHWIRSVLILLFIFGLLALIIAFCLYQVVGGIVQPKTENVTRLTIKVMQPLE